MSAKVSGNADAAIDGKGAQNANLRDHAMRGIGARDPTAVAVRNGSSTSTPAIRSRVANAASLSEKLDH